MTEFKEDISLLGELNTQSKAIINSQGITSPYALSVQSTGTLGYIEILTDSANSGFDKGAFFGIEDNGPALTDQWFSLYNWQGGPIKFWTDTVASSGVVVMTIGNDGVITFDSYGAGFLQTNASGVITSAALTKSDISDFVEGDYVHTTMNETVAGVKTFTDDVPLIIDSSLQSDNLEIGAFDGTTIDCYGIRRSGASGLFCVMPNSDNPQIFLGSEDNTTGSAFIDVDNNRPLNLNVLDTGDGTPAVVNIGSGGLNINAGGDITLGASNTVDGVDVGSPINSIEVSSNAYQLVGDVASPGNNFVYGTNGSGVKGWKPDPAGGGGETNTASNLGAGIGVFDGKVGVDLQFRSLISQNGLLTIALDAPNDEIDFTINEASINHDNLTGFVANEHIDWTLDQGATNINAANIEISIDDLTDADTTTVTPTSGNFLYWDGSNWVPTETTTSHITTLDGSCVANFIDTTGLDFCNTQIGPVSGSAFYVGQRALGTIAAPTALGDGTKITGYSAAPHDGTDFQVSAEMSFYTVGATSPTNQGTRMEFLTTPGGSTTSTVVWTINDDGLQTMTGNSAGHVLTVQNLTASGELYNGLNLNGNTVFHVNTGAGGDGILRVVTDAGVNLIEADSSLGIITTDIVDYEQNVTDINDIPNKGYVDITSAREFYTADSFQSPNGTDWAVNDFASLGADTNNRGLRVRRFDDTTDEGIGFIIKIPNDATNIVFNWISRAETTPGGAVTAALDFYERQVSGGAVTAWSTVVALTSIDLPTNEQWQNDTQTVALSTLGLTAGEVHQIEIVRDGGTLVGDWTLLSLEILFT